MPSVQVYLQHVKYASIPSVCGYICQTLSSLVSLDGCGEIDDTSTGTTGSPHLLSPQDDVSTDGRKNRPQSYILFEGQEGEEKGYIHIRRE